MTKAIVDRLQDRETGKEENKSKQGNFGWLAGKFSMRKQIACTLPIFSQEIIIPAQAGKTWRLPYSKKALLFFFLNSRVGRKTISSYLWIQCLTSSSVPEYKVTSSWQERSWQLMGRKILTVGFLSEPGACTLYSHDQMHKHFKASLNFANSSFSYLIKSL